MSEEELVARFTAAHREGSGAALASRVALLQRASEELERERFVRFVAKCWRTGDLREQQAVLRALPSLPDPERWMRIAREGCRSNIAALFEAIATDNAYPAREFAEPDLNQTVIKALFIGVPVARIVGLEARMNAELRRMATDYVSERRAAGRSVPDDALALADGRVPRDGGDA
jgi:hypothetical protein